MRRRAKPDDALLASGRPLAQTHAMKSHIPAFLAAAVFLSACSDQDWNHALTFTGLGGHEDARDARPVARDVPAPMTAQVTTAPIPEGAQPQPNAFCESVASQDAKGNDYDPPT